MNQCSTNWLLGMVSGLACVAFNANAQISADNYQVYGVRPEPDAKIVLDGHLNETIWSQVSSMGEFHFIEQIDSHTPERQTSVKVFYTEEALFLGIECSETQIDAMPANLIDNSSSAFWDDDCLEIYIDPRLTYRHFKKVVINPKGVIWALSSDGVYYDQTWFYRCGVEAAAAILNDRWVVELRIPFSGIGLSAKPHDLWAFNIRRLRWGEPRKLEDSSWSPGALSTNPWRFGHLYFQEHTGMVQIESLSPLWRRSQGAVIEFITDKGRLFMHDNGGILDERFTSVDATIKSCQTELDKQPMSAKEKDVLGAHLNELKTTLNQLKVKRGKGDVPPMIMAETFAPLQALDRRAKRLYWEIIWTKTRENAGVKQ